MSKRVSVMARRFAFARLFHVVRAGAWEWPQNGFRMASNGLHRIPRAWKNRWNAKPRRPQCRH